MTTKPLTSRFAEFATSHRYADIPERAIEQAVLAILDVVGVTIAGAETSLGRSLIRFAERFDGDGPSTVIHAPSRTSPVAAARTNGSLAHVLDFDDRGHASTHLFASVLATAELRRTSGEEVLRAYVLAREIRLALDRVVDDGRLEGRGPGSRGWHSTGLNGPIASAAASGLILGLDEAHLAVAMAMAASSSSGLIRNFGTGTKPQHAGRAAGEGVLASLMAAEGVDADLAAIDGPAGLFEAIGLDPGVTAAATGTDLGSTWDLVERGVRIKPYPSCTTSHVGIETALAIHREHGPVDLSGIDEIRMDVRPFMLMHPAPESPIQARFSMAHGVLVALEQGSVALADYADDVVARLAGLDAYKRVKDVPSSREIEIRLSDGGVIRRGLEPLRNLTDHADIEAKFLANVGGALDGRSGELLGALKGLARIDDMRELGSVLRTEPGEPAGSPRRGSKGLD